MDIGQLFHGGSPRSAGRPSFFSLLFILVLFAGSGAAVAERRDFAVKGENRSYTLAGFTGRPLVLYFLSFKCPHCRNIEPLMKAMATEGRGRFAMLGVVYGTPVPDLFRVGRERDLNFPLAQGNKPIARDYGVKGVPSFWLLDANGNAKDRFSGEAGAAMLYQTLAPCRISAAKTDCLARRQGVHEIINEAGQFAGRDVEVTARLVARVGEGYVLSNGIDELNVAPALQNALPKFENKFVLAKGRVMQDNGKAALAIKEISESR